jgi:creatinine amidohydrolase/Fe(II)-dependent formamide hydrolase-like protein
VEADGPHLPVGASLRIAEAFAKEAAKLEIAVVFPAFEFGDTAGTVERRGSVNLKAKLRTATLEGYCMEISRAGFDKILVVPYPPLHPGLGAFFSHFTRFLNHIPREFSIFSCVTTPSIKDVIYPAILEKGAEYCPELLPEDIEILRE